MRTTYHPWPRDNTPASRPVAHLSEVKVAIGSTHDHARLFRERRMALNAAVERSRNGRGTKAALINLLASLSGRL